MLVIFKGLRFGKLRGMIPYRLQRLGLVRSIDLIKILFQISENCPAFFLIQLSHCFQFIDSLNLFALDSEANIALCSL